MTETSDSKLADTAVSGGSVAAAGKAPAARSRSSWKGLLAAFIIVLLLALGLGFLLWKQRALSAAANQQTAARIEQLNRDLAQARQDGKQALALAQAQSGQVADLQESMLEVQSQNSAMQQAWQALSSGANDEILINDVERSITLASQQLRLAGDVGNAIVALETAQSRMAHANRPDLAPLQQAVNSDLDRLRAVTAVDIPTQSARIERLMSLVDTAPLLVPGQAAPVAPPPQAAAAPLPQATGEADEPPAAAPWWRRWYGEVAQWPGRAGGALARELGDLIRVQRVDTPAALLLSPEQADMVRAALHQRLLTAQLALLMRQQTVWASEFGHIHDTFARYFDDSSPDTTAALALVRELSSADIAVRVPDVSDSLNRLAALRARAAGSRNGP